MHKKKKKLRMVGNFEKSKIEAFTPKGYVIMGNYNAEVVIAKHEANINLFAVWYVGKKYFYGGYYINNLKDAEKEFASRIY